MRDVDSGVSVRAYLLATLGYGLLAFVLLHPVFLRATSEFYAPDSPFARPVGRWVMWVLAWGTHATLDSDATIFGANAFHPFPTATAIGEPLIGLLPLFGLAYVMSGNPVLAYQWMLLLTLGLCGASMYTLMRFWGCGVPAALLAGIVYVFCPARIAVLGEVAYISGQYLPLVLVFLDRVLSRPTIGAMLGVFAFGAWQLLCGNQQAYPVMILVALYLVARCVLRDRGLSVVGLGAAIASCSAAVVVWGLSLGPYREVLAEGIVRVPDIVGFPQVGFFDLLRAHAWPPYLASDGGEKYVGVVVLLLALFGALWAPGFRLLTLSLVATAAACYWLSLGPLSGDGGVEGARAWSLYGWGYRWIPGFSFHAPAASRFAEVAMLLVAALAGIGAHSILARFAAPRGLAPVGVVLVLCGLVLVDYRIPMQGFQTQKAVVLPEHLPLRAALADLPQGPILELPIDPCSLEEATVAADRMLKSSVHWLPTLDGYRDRGREPVAYETVRALANVLPDPKALEWLSRLTGLRYVVVHLSEREGPWRHRWAAVEGMTRIGFFGHDLLFDVVSERRGDMRSQLQSLHRRTDTLAGQSIEVLSEYDRATTISISQVPPRSAGAAQRIGVEVIVDNRSQSIWPALSAQRDRRIYLSYLWTDTQGNLTGGNAIAQALPYDLAPGESVVVPVCVETPQVSGEMDLAFGLTQAEQWFPDLSEQVRVRILP